MSTFVARGGWRAPPDRELHGRALSSEQAPSARDAPPLQSVSPVGAPAFDAGGERTRPRYGTFPPRSSHVLGMGDGFQVIGVDAGADPARMVEFQSFGDTAAKQDVSPLVLGVSPFVNVALGNPATGSRIDRVRRDVRSVLVESDVPAGLPLHLAASGVARCDDRGSLAATALTQTEGDGIVRTRHLDLQAGRGASLAGGVTASAGLSL